MLLLVALTLKQFDSGNSASIRLIDRGNSATIASLFNFFWLITYLKRLCPLPNRILLGTILISSPLSCRCYCLNQIINDMVICFKWLSLHFWGTQTTIGDAIRYALCVYAMFWTMPMHIGILSPMICHKLFHTFSPVQTFTRQLIMYMQRNPSSDTYIYISASYWGERDTGWPIRMVKTSRWLLFGIVHHPAWGVGNCSSGLPAAKTVGTESTGGFYHTPCTNYKP